MSGTHDWSAPRFRNRSYWLRGEVGTQAVDAMPQQRPVFGRNHHSDGVEANAHVYERFVVHVLITNMQPRKGLNSAVSTFGVNFAVNFY